MRIKELRQAQGITQRELGEKIGCTQTAVGKYERKELEPNINLLFKLSDIFGVSIDYLVGREDEFGNVTVAGAGAELTPEEQTLLSCYRVITEAEKRAVLDTAKAFAERTSTKNKWA